MSDSKSNHFKKGDKVEWESSQGTVEGTVKKKLTKPIDIKGHHVTASKDNPEYLVESDRTGKEAAHKPESLQPRKD
jgi:Hypervirulence associated proteins TUDOR domain